MPRWKKVTALVIGLVVLTSLGVYVVAGYTVLSLTQCIRVPTKGSPAGFRQSYEDVAFPARIDGLALRGWYLPADSSGPLYRGKRAIIMVQGKDGNRVGNDGELLPLVVSLARQGFNALVYDSRCNGESEGSFFSLGYYERRDVLGAVDYLKPRGFASGSIGVLGFSMGAATALLAAADSTDLAAVVSDSSFACLRPTLDVLLPKESGLPAFFNEPIYQMAKLLRGIDVDAVCPMEIIAKISPRLILLIHGKADQLIPVGDAYRLYEASDKAHTELWVVDGVGHTASYAKMTMEYVARVASFFEGGLSDSEEAP